MRRKLVFVGEGNSGKSSILHKYKDPSYEVKQETRSFNDYFSGKVPVRANTTVNGVDMIVAEVAGSRGRYDNYYEIMKTCANGNNFFFSFLLFFSFFLFSFFFFFFFFYYFFIIIILLL